MHVYLHVHLLRGGMGGGALYHCTMHAFDVAAPPVSVHKGTAPTCVNLQLVGRDSRTLCRTRVGGWALCRVLPDLLRDLSLSLSGRTKQKDADSGSELIKPAVSDALSV